MKLDEILSYVKSAGHEDTKLYLITRLLKPGMPKKSRVRDKYLFKVYQVDCNDELRKFILVYHNTLITSVLNIVLHFQETK